MKVLVPVLLLGISISSVWTAAHTNNPIEMSLVLVPLVCLIAYFVWLDR